MLGGLRGVGVGSGIARSLSVGGVTGRLGSRSLGRMGAPAPAGVEAGWGSAELGAAAGQARSWAAASGPRMRGEGSRRDGHV